jgi:RNA recognition motif-containing protein
MPAKLYVGGLSYSTTSESLREYFAQCGNVESATVITDRFSGQSRGFGFVEMATDAEAQTAIQKLNDQPFEGRRITVQPANSSGQRSGGGGGGRGGGGGFRSGGGGGGFGGGGGGGQRRTPRW